MKGERVVFTLGTSTRSLEEFVSILRSRGIERVCDVRSFPTSRRYPHFSREPLEASLRQAGVDYIWLGRKLGGYRKGGYLAYTGTPEYIEGLEELESCASGAPTAVVCAEMLPWKCHRRFIAASLGDRGWRVVHVIDTERDWIPKEKTAPLPFPDDPARK